MEKALTTAQTENLCKTQIMHKTIIKSCGIKAACSESNTLGTLTAAIFLLSKHGKLKIHELSKTIHMLFCPQVKRRTIKRSELAPYRQLSSKEMHSNGCPTDQRAPAFVSLGQFLNPSTLGLILTTVRWFSGMARPRC